MLSIFKWSNMILRIDGVKLKPLFKIEDDRGKLLHMLREDSEEFKRFGEIYFSFTKSNFIKGWYRHKKILSILP